MKEITLGAGQSGQVMFFLVVAKGETLGRYEVDVDGEKASFDVGALSHVQGRVELEARTNHGGASVTFSGKSPVVTDADGNFGIDLADGTYTVTVERDGFLKATKANLVVNQDRTLPPVKLLAGDIDGNGVIDVKDRLAGC